MAGPIPNLIPGYSASNASAIKWAEECQNVDLPSLSFQVSRRTVASCSIGRDASQTSPFTSAASTFRAKPSEMDCATSIADVPEAYCRTEPSGRVMFIIYKYDFVLLKHSNKPQYKCDFLFVCKGKKEI